MTSVVEDFRDAFRIHLRRPGISATMILILGVGIGVNTAIFNLVNAMLIRPFPYRAPERLVALHSSQIKKGTTWNPVSPKNVEDWSRESQAFEEVGSFARASFNLSSEERPERISGARISASLFPLLGVEPHLGRSFTAQEQQLGHKVALLSHSLWQRHFQSDREIVGRTLRLDDELHTVVGVMRPGFEFPEWAKLWTPLAIEWESARRDDRFLGVFARLAPGMSVAQAQSSLDTVARKLAESYPETNLGWGAHVRPLRDELMPREARLGMYLMLAAVSFVLLIVCANVATLQLAQITRRTREYALRKALGAGRLRIARQVLTESLLVALFGGALGVAVSLLAVKSMVAAVPVPIPFWIQFTLDYRVLLFTLCSTLAAGVLFGLAPALRPARSDQFGALKEEGTRSAGGRSHSLLRNLLVGTEFAVSLVLLIAAMLMLKGFYQLQNVDRGFGPENVLTLRFTLTGQEYETPSWRRSFERQVLERVAALPGVETAGLVDYLPTSRNGYVEATVRTDDRAFEPGEEPISTLHGITRDYLDTMDIALVRGRFFTQQEVREGEPVAVVSQSLAERLWPNTDPLERRIRTDEIEESLAVVGTVRNVKQAYSMGGLDAWPDAQLYVPLAHLERSSLTLAVRTEGPPETLATAVRAAVAEAAPHLPLFDVFSMDDVLARFEWLPRFWSQMFTALALIALFIATVGIYGVTSYSVSQRLQEIGIRMALGARPVQLLRDILRQGARLVSVSLAVGLLLAFLTTRAMSALLHGVSSTDVIVYGAVTLLMALVALVANYLPARRALRVDPTMALRCE